MRHPRASNCCVVLSAALVMAATLPGRTHGLGLITTRLLSDYSSLSETRFAQINLIATLIGSLFCLPAGWLVDRLGSRYVLLATTLALAATVWGMTLASDLWLLAVLITLSRGLGQSMLSVISISMLGKWFRGAAGWAMGAYAVLMSLLMAAGTGWLAGSVAAAGWRDAWLHLAIGLAILALLAFVLAPRKDGAEAPVAHALGSPAASSATLGDALSTGCFWVFALSISFFGLIASGVSLFQQLILAERGLPEEVFHRVLVIGLLAGLVANLVGGWATRRLSLSSLLAFAMTMLAGSLAALPLLRTAGHAYAQAVVSGVAGGLLTVLSFAVWGHAFGPRSLGRIQSVAQMLTVLASAAGPLIVAHGHERYGSYLPVLGVLASVCAVLAIAAAFVPVPSAARGDWDLLSRPAPILAPEA